MDTVRLRGAVPGDAPALAALHVASWRETYAGILPGDMLARLCVEDRATAWARILGDAAAGDGTEVHLAEDRENLVGFGACGRQRDQGLAGSGFSGEIGAIYVLRSHQRLGLGRALMRLMAQSLIGRDHRAASLWVLRDNQVARSFYERLGGAIVGEKTDALPDGGLTELAYGWRDLSVLAG